MILLPNPEVPFINEYHACIVRIVLSSVCNSGLKALASHLSCDTSLQKRILILNVALGFPASGNQTSGETVTKCLDECTEAIIYLAHLQAISTTRKNASRTTGRMMSRGGGADSLVPNSSAVTFLSTMELNLELNDIHGCSLFSSFWTN